MSDFTFRTAVTTDDGTDWLFGGPDPALTYGLRVSGTTGKHQGFSRTHDDGPETSLGRAETAQLVAISDRVANPVSRTLDETVAFLKLLRQAAAGTPVALEDEKLQLSIARLEKVSRLAGELYESSEALLSAYGGDTPDWLRTEAINVEDALIKLRKAAAPLPQEDHRTSRVGLGPK